MLRSEKRWMFGRFSHRECQDLRGPANIARQQLKAGVLVERGWLSIYKMHASALGWKYVARVPAWDGHARTEWDATEGSHTLSTDSCGHKDDIASHDAQLVACVAVSHPKGKREHANEVESQPGLSCFPNGGPRTTKKANARSRTARERMPTPIKATHARDARTTTSHAQVRALTSDTRGRFRFLHTQARSTGREPRHPSKDWKGSKPA